MNKKVIWLIIGLMSAALIGVAGMQLKWVMDALDANEAQFNSRVFDALNGVAEKLENQEYVEVLRNVESGFAQEYYEEDLRRRIESGELTVSVDAGDHGVTGHVHLTKQQLIQLTLGQEECDCAECRDKRARKLSQIEMWESMIDLAPVAQRIELDKLKAFLRQEFQDRGINIPFRYGVYDNRKNSFVIADGRYVVEENHSPSTQTGYKNLHNSEYRVNLFENGIDSPALLVAYFPMKSSFLWSSVIKTLLGSILFMCIILFCFAYTISVIFRQKKVSEMKNDFINNMTHEFKTPIATISLAADSISSPRIIGQPDRIKRFTDIIRQENKRMNNQVEKVLQMAVIDRKDFTMNMTDVNIHEVIRSAVEYISLQVEKKQGNVETDLQADPAIIQGDLTHISNIINNLLDNANKYSPEKPEISVSTRNVNGGVEVIVSDKGIGMTKEARKHIFEKFYRVHTGNLHDVKGFGLGLSYVKAMMLAHGGKVEVRSELGKGSSFILFFPNSNGT